MKQGTYDRLFATERGRDILDRAVIDAQINSRRARMIHLPEQTFWLFVAAYKRLRELERRAKRGRDLELQAKTRIRDLEAEVSQLKARQEEHLRLIRTISTEAIDPEEADELRGQLAALIAEVGTLRAKRGTLDK